MACWLVAVTTRVKNIFSSWYVLTLYFEKNVSI